MGVKTDSVIKVGESSFIMKKFIDLKVRQLIRKCDSINDYLKQKKLLGKEDSFVYVLKLGEGEKSNPEACVIVKGYNKDGSLKELQKFQMEQGEVREVPDSLILPITVLDLYEENLYLYNTRNEENYIVGYMVKAEKMTSNGLKMIFTKDCVKVNMYNVNKKFVSEKLDSFVDEVLL